MKNEELRRKFIEKYYQSPVDFNYKSDLYNISDFFLSQREKDVQELVEKLEGLRKEQLDPQDPDNYGACYAIGGFNDGITKVQELIKNLIQ